MSVSRHLPPETIRRIAVANPIEEIIGADISLRKFGAVLTGLCPFHRERTPSLTVTPARRRYKCFGCGAGGDVFGYVMAREGIGFPEAVRRLAHRGGIFLEEESSFTPQPVIRRRPPKRPPCVPLRTMQLPPDLHPATRANLETLGLQRELSIAGLELAVARGLLWSATLRGVRCWIVTDTARVNAQARRLDGGLWAHIGNKKAYTLPGSRAAWPIGAKEADAFPCVALVEGGPDLLAAHHFIVAEGRQGDTAAVAMLGAASNIPEDALLLLANKRVRLFPHLDAAGWLSAVAWSRQLERVGCEVDAFAFDGLRRSSGEPVGDLNDLAVIHADDFEAERASLERILP